MNMINYVIGGNCVFTLNSSKINERYTYQVKKRKSICRPDEPTYEVYVMFGNDNVKNYRFLGYFEKEFELRNPKVSETKRTSFAMFKMFLDMLTHKTEWRTTCEFYPSNTCARCGRRLTTPESIKTGFGPECLRRRLEQ